MANAIRILVSLMAVLLCLASIGSAQDDSEFATEARRLVAIYKNPAVDDATKQRNLESLAKFYEQHSDHIQLSENEKQRVSEFLEKQRRPHSAEVLVDGVPPNGGIWMGIFLPPVIDIIAKVVDELVKNHRKATKREERSTSSAKGVEINREYTIFGLPTCLGLNQCNPLNLLL